MRVKSGIVAGICTAALLVSGVAYAYIGVHGSGNGTFDTGAASTMPVDIWAQSGLTLSMGERVDLSGTLFNSNRSTVGIREIAISILSIGGPGAGMCSRENNVDFRIINAVPQSPFVVPAATADGAGELPWSGGSIELVNSPDRYQNGCLNRRIQLAYRGITA